MGEKLDRYERLWREYWRQTHAPDQNGEYYFDRQDREEAQRRAALQHEGDQRG